MNDFFKGIILIVLGIGIGFLYILVPDLIGVVAPVGTILILLGLIKIVYE